jgi:predicted dehydrogenase
MSRNPETIGIGLVGYGHWGPNHARVFNQTLGSRVPIIADQCPQRRKVAQAQFPGTEVTPDYDAVLQHPGVDAVVIATPTRTHCNLVKSSLLAGKDVLPVRLRRSIGAAA